jgi:pimeloyl-ACP methyl ester carboxylesterase
VPLDPGAPSICEEPPLDMSSSRGRDAAIGAIAIAGVIGALALIAVLAPPANPTTPTATPGTASSQEFGAVGTTETVPCPEFLKSGAAFAAAGTEVEGKTFSCGVVVVPENHDKPDGRTIELFYLKLHSTAASPEPDPLVYLAGGPGASGSNELTANPLLYQNIGRIRERRDIIAYDQRGTGFSNYLVCAPFESSLGVLQDRDKNPQIAATIKDLQDTEQGVGYSALRANLCGVGTRILAGVDLGQYNSVASARDIEALAKALGYTEGVNLYGTSYGTVLAQFAMRTIPDSVKGVILDGPGGPAIPNAMWAGLKNISPYGELFKQCEADAACATAYPDIAKRFGALLDKLAKTPLVLDPPIVVNPTLAGLFPPVLKQIDADFFVRLAALNNIALGGGFAAAVPRIIQAAEQGDVGYFRSIPVLSAGASGPDAPKTVPQTGKGTAPTVAADQPLYEVPFLTVLSLAQSAAAAKGQAGIDTQWLAVVLGDLAARLQTGENQADLMEALLQLAVVPNKGTTAKDLTDYANAALSADAATAANAVAGTMTRDDVRATMWSIQDVAMSLGTPADERHFSDGMQTAVNCASELAFSSLDQAKTALADSAYPQLAVFPIEVAERSLASCVAYPTTLDRSVIDPVVSDIPTLLFLEALDNETPTAWGRSVAEGLSKSQVVEWNNMGHIAAAHDSKLCAGGIASDFLSDPSKAPDLACSKADDYKINFALK